LLRSVKISLAAASAALLRSVKDDPSAGAAALGRSEPESGGFSATRHRSNHSTNQASVTNNLPSGMVARKVPFLIALRNVEIVMGPSGKNTSTACSRV
jgi:hypothetical protein